ncbi:TPA: DUF551 domain-containing protein [Klebsiella pneumoniae]|nr:DUF551 domain-containing protein [Klebsiella pneumoniae]HBX6302835.1 DUF551 domain-containing protein [Klebsiella pneumoniae]HBX7247662.1 DUF551 domain-containing protein [Klebsiella pneumoniae]HBX7489757.1 DUF551 domain-containing protein [Klebsiella pneumoniae]
MTSNQLAENSVIQLLNSVKLARDNAERADNRVDHSFYYALTIALEELQERRKADTEPYGFTDGYRRGMIYKPEHADRLSEPVQVYRHAQPAPVVPEKCPAEIRDLISSHTDALFNDDDAQEIWNACRAAMLAAAPQSPGSEPATVPGSWIPVSEQMPIEFEAVIAFDGDQVYGEAMYSSDDGFTIDGYEPCDRLNLQNVTYWMPLPAAPQEVKGE